MKFKTKIMIILASILITLMGFNLIATYVYSGMLEPRKYAKFEVAISSMTEAEKEPSKGCY